MIHFTRRDPTNSPGLNGGGPAASTRSQPSPVAALRLLLPRVGRYEVFDPSCPAMQSQYEHLHSPANSDMRESTAFRLES